MRRRAPTLAVALHDVEPATFERCAEVRAWLAEHGVDRVTLLAIPARDLHPLGERSPELAAWLAERRRHGDAIAQHGFQHEPLGSARWTRRLLAPARGGRAAEFARLDREEARRAVEAGWRVLKLAGIEPDGFVAPAYAYTPALRRVLSPRFRWWADAWSLHGGGEQSWRLRAPAFGASAAGAGALLAGTILRLDLSPTCLERRRHRRALEWALARAAERRPAVTYDELAAVAAPAAAPGPQEAAPRDEPARARLTVVRRRRGRPAAPAGGSPRYDTASASRETSVGLAPSSAAAAAVRHGRA